jgi:ABC-type multidrug transport system ATPase subunit
MGASGAGKTTLLNALTFRNLKKLDVSGNVYANGYKVHAGHMTAISAYVQQEDLFIGTLTVREVLKFQVRENPTICSTRRMLEGSTFF